VPADCVLVDETNITVDESMYNSKDTAVEKSESFCYGDEYNREYDNHKEHPDPFLLSGSMIMTGSGRAIVCAVGKETRLAITRKPQDLMIKE
jgi:magnesium-transporting ATPase (P-type)